MPIHYIQNVAVGTGTDLTATFSIKNELVYRVIISCKYDGLTSVKIPNMIPAQENTAPLTIESYLDLDVIDFVDGEYQVSVNNSYASDNEISIIVLSLSLYLAKKLSKLGILQTFMTAKIPASSIHTASVGES